MKPVVLASILLSFALHAQAQTSIFGMQLGARLSVQECEKVKTATTVIYRPAVNAPCFKRLWSSGETGRITTDTVAISLPIGQIPSPMSGTEVMALVLDGNLEGVGFNTAGIRTQEIALAELTEKFGPPDSLERRPAQNALGASFDVIYATWSQSGPVVRFDGASGNITSGFVTVDTPKAHAWRAQALKALTEKKPKL
ncbi:hypothetical protein [Rubrivivax gelatinosus]|uniref:hypothetical protein n=1 Tax=Rubrivivax gelatinosus TaxID=28068 RepID=UPI0019054861|nr:hypothetical protein [Rubrivivax gelatinosus]